MSASRRVCLLLGLAASSWNPVAERPASASQGARVGVLLSQEAAPYREALEGFRQALGEQNLGTELNVQVIGASPDTALAAARELGRRADLVFALGSAATQAASRGAPGVPVVSGLVLRASELGGSPNTTGVYLEFPLEVEFQWMRRLLPRRRHVGVLFNPTENGAKIEKASRVAASMALELHPRRVESPSQIPRSLDSLADEADVLWGVADNVVLTPETAKAILLFSLRNRVPFVGLSFPWVKAGALYALDRDYVDIGRQCAEMAARILRGEPPGSLPPVPPRRIVYFVNKRTASQMKLDFPPDVLGAARDVVE
jgi:putative ABC transport system substrate-binding protein